MTDQQQPRNTRQVLDPFTHKMAVLDYLALVQAVIDNPHLFRHIRRLHEHLQTENDDAAFRTVLPRIVQYQQLMSRWRHAEWRRENFCLTAGRFLEELLHYHYFFKEMGAALKFNPLSTRPSGGEMRRRLLELLERHHALIRPRAMYRRVDVVIGDGRVTVVSANTVFASRNLAGFFTSAGEQGGSAHSMTVPPLSDGAAGSHKCQREVFLYLVTIGGGIDDAVRELMQQGEMFDAYLLNGIGGGAAEMVAQDLNLYINDQHAAGDPRAAYQRFSPGYGDWPVSDQRKLFALLQPQDCLGVFLSAGDIMIPEKSTSGMMGQRMPKHTA